MLKLKRRAGETIVINDNIYIHIDKTASGGCEIGIDAPLTERIRRGELLQETETLLQRTAEAIGVSE